MKQVGIIARDEHGRIVQTYRSQTAAATAGHCRQAINACLSGKRQKHAGFAWQRATLADWVRCFAQHKGFTYSGASRLRDAYGEFVNWHNEPVTQSEFNAAIDKWAAG